MFDLSPVWKSLRGSGKRRAPVRKPPRPRLALEALDERILPSVTEFSIPTPNSNLYGITRGPDGNLWFTEQRGPGGRLGGAIGRITPSGVVTVFSLGSITQPNLITAGPDGNLWFAVAWSDFLQPLAA
jgi:virginiamycin B lyase